MGLLSFLPIIDTIIDRVIPDKNAARRVKAAMAKEEQSGELKIMLAQVNANAAEGKHSSIFVAGWRPFIGWACGAIFVYHGIAMPIVQYVAVFNGFDVSALPQFDVGLFSTTLFGMLGIGGMRSYEKFKGVARNKL